MAAAPVTVSDATPAERAALASLAAAEALAPRGDTFLALRFHGALAGGGWIAVRGSEAEAVLVVDRTHRGLGLGKMLLGALETRARREGARTLAVPAARCGDVARWMLRRAGYEARDEAFRKALEGPP